MKKFYIFLAAFSLMAITSPCFSSFIIEFVNGNRIWVNQYWEEGDNIKCDLYGGIVSFHKDTIKTIYLSDLPYTYKTSPSENENDIGEKEKSTETDGGESSEQTSSEQGPDQLPEVAPPELTEMEKMALMKEKDDLTSQYQRAAMEYKKAKNSRDAEALKTANEKFVILREQEASLTNRVKERNNGSLPDWWTSESENFDEQN